MKDYTQHIDALHSLAMKLRNSPDIDMKANAATLDWLAGEWENCLFEARLDALEAQNERTLQNVKEIVGA